MKSTNESQPNSSVFIEVNPDQHLLSLLLACQPASLFVVSEALMPSIAAYAEQSGCLVTQVQPSTSGFSAESVLSQRPAEMAIVAGISNSLPKTKALAVVGSIRNVIATKIAAYEQQESEAGADSSLSCSDWYSLGFKKLATFPPISDNESWAGYQHAFGYDLNNYNHKRDWNNSKYWANPEMWDKY